MTSVSDRVLRWAPFALLVATLCWVVTQAWGPLKDPDSWWHLRLGDDFLDQHSFATPGHWSSFATASWVPTEPLPEVVTAFVRRWFGLPGVVWLYVATGRRGGPGRLLRLPSVRRPAAGRGGDHALRGGRSGLLTPRPQLVSYVLLVVLLAAWLRTEQDLRPRWWLVPLCWLWSLCHGFWFIGVVYGVPRRRGVRPGPSGRREELAPAGCPGRGLRRRRAAQPGGSGSARGAFAVSQITQYITEWARPSITAGPPLTATAMAVVVAVVWACGAAGRPGSPPSVLVSALFWAWYAVRTSCSAALVAAPLFAGVLAVPGAGPNRARPGALRAALRAPGPRRRRCRRCSRVAAVVVPHTADRPGRRADARSTPQLDRLPAGTAVFNAYALGGWIAWRHPDLEAVHRRPDHAVLRPEHAQRYYRSPRRLDPGWYATSTCLGRAGRAARVGLRPRPRRPWRRHGWRRRWAPDAGLRAARATGRRARPVRRRRRGRAAPSWRRGSRTTR